MVRRFMVVSSDTWLGRVLGGSAERVKRDVRGRSVAARQPVPTPAARSSQANHGQG